MMVMFSKTDEGKVEFEKMLNDLKEQGYALSDRKAKGGYLTRKCIAKVSDYKGHHGTGLKIEMPRYDTAGMHWIIYAVKAVFSE